MNAVCLVQSTKYSFFFTILFYQYTYHVQIACLVPGKGGGCQNAQKQIMIVAQQNNRFQCFFKVKVRGQIHFKSGN